MTRDTWSLLAQVRPSENNDMLPEHGKSGPVPTYGLWVRLSAELFKDSSQYVSRNVATHVPSEPPSKTTC